MNFCPDCETYLVTQISAPTSGENSNKLLNYYCNNCSYKKTVDIVKEPEYKCVYQNNYNTKKIKINQKNIQYLCNDPTLPHVNNIDCPNPECSSKKENPELLPTDEKEVTLNKNDVLYIKLNESDLTFLYQCCNCKHTWTNK
jgi:DNA-directed RNA polymerase subunit M/transcription elongation factor TFIIS